MSTRDRVMLLVLFVGFVTLFFEVRYEHRIVLHKYWEPWIPIVYSALAALACLIGMGAKKVPRTIAATVFFLGLFVGGFGFYKHSEFDIHKFQKFVMPDAKIMEQGPDFERPVILDRPLAAPLSLAGLAAIGFLVTSGLFKPTRGS